MYLDKSRETLSTHRYTESSTHEPPVGLCLPMGIHSRLLVLRLSIGRDINHACAHHVLALVRVLLCTLADLLDREIESGIDTPSLNFAPFLDISPCKQANVRDSHLAFMRSHKVTFLTEKLMRSH